MYVKKFIAMLTFMSVTMSAVGCQSRNGDSSLSENESSVIVNEVTGTKLKNFMTQKELDRVKVGELTLLDNDTSVSKTDESSRSENQSHDVKIYFQTADDMRKECNKNDYDFTEEEYNELMEELDKMESVNYRYLCYALVDGRQVYNFLPEYNYDGGTISITYGSSDDWQELTFSDFDEYKVFVKDEINKIYDNTLFDTEQIYEDTVAVWQSVIDKTYTEISLEEAEKIISENPFPYESPPFDGDYKGIWEYNRNEVEEIKDSVKEISIYDEELDTEFLVHVTLPPDFDESKTYPMFVFSDGVWRFGNVPSIRKLMENDEIQDVILVTIGYNYKIDGTSMVVRSKYFYEEREKTLDFLTDNLAPYLNELYNIDFEHSGFYGHSAGGVMAHYAVFNSDKYENQPFKYYIIGSPALWQLHRLENEKYPDANVTDYNYWDRNDTLDKVIFLCGGENEDPDYEEYYDGYDTTLEGIANLMSRLENHGVNTAISKIYENSGHWQFIPDMFIEFFRKYYGSKSE